MIIALFIILVNIIILKLKTFITKYYIYKEKNSKYKHKYLYVTKITQIKLLLIYDSTIIIVISNYFNDH